MYWFLTWAWTIGGTALFWRILSAKWDELDPFERIMISQIRVLHPIPGADKYMDLKYSILRHSVIFFISALCMSWAESRFITSLITFLNLLYCYMPIVRYKIRRKEVNDTISMGSPELAAFMDIPVQTSFCCVFHAVTSVVLLYILILFR